MGPMRSLLIVEDDPGLREQMKWAFCEAFDVREADSLDTALEAFRDGAEPPAMVCLDMGLEGRSDRGLDVIDALLSADRGCKIVAVTASGDEGMGREAIRRGAFDYLRKPVDPSALRHLFDRALRIRDLEADESWTPAPALPGHAGAEAPGEPPFLGESEAMRRLAAIVRRLAPADVDVLVTGEPGSGKEACARVLHARGPRRGRAFLAVACGSPGADLEAELFGPPDGGRPGLIEAAEGGTLFLDSVEAMPAAAQARMLRFLHDRSLPASGPRPAERPRMLDVRVVAAATRQADGTVPASDLIRRLGEFEIALPPLRERGRDALLIATALVERNRQRFSQPRLRLSSRAEKSILSYGWPGNVRELENRVNRASVECRNQVIEEEDLQIGESSVATLNYREQRRLFEKNLLLSALRRTNGNVSLAARTMGVTRPTFYDMMRKSGVSLR